MEASLPAIADPEADSSHVTEATVFSFSLETPALWGIYHLSLTLLQKVKASFLQNTRHVYWYPSIKNYNGSYSLHSQYRPDSVLYVTLSHLIITTCPWGRCCDPPHLADSSSQTFLSVC